MTVSVFYDNNTEISRPVGLRLIMVTLVTQNVYMNFFSAGSGTCRPLSLHEGCFFCYFAFGNLFVIKFSSFDLRCHYALGLLVK